MWDKPFHCRFTVTLQEASLDTELVVENTGNAGDKWAFQAALHSEQRLVFIWNQDIQ
jgi:hypothetical protein